MKKASYLLLALFGLISFSAQADVTTAEQAAKQYSLFAKSTLSADDGKEFYTRKQMVKGKDLACSTCHTDNPANKGKHNESGKEIQPMAPSANPKRFSDLNESAKGFTKHCKQVYGKDCSAKDKGNFIAYVLTFK
ncbi:MAG TPA: hypothetical protein DE312_02835 [Gallionella sp.]|jgi:epoxyqueuosine reductase QueG|nr:MAG: hypothetical protein A2Z87_04500 [Gallionellales bacterium GWA2_54_124]OGT19579.1 MAG: hypothetical protein A2522_07970 [Gallionellales bacterium RIFOXYD12_FULL_53_10]OGT38676.1 MAG: hypothetical protein A3K00_04725 [Gallionellales bacterium RIFOXYD2_FULL_52_7]HCI52260.1 hypothetical protein [Gallionella sp.]